MKIISYNILGTKNKSVTEEKVRTILKTMPADVWIIAEMYEDTHVPDGYTLFWQGDKGIKGLGVIVRKDLKCERLFVDGLTKYCVPVSVEGKLIVGMWPTEYLETEKIPYPKLLETNLTALESHLTNQPSIIGGDMNCYVGQGGERKKCSIKTIVDWLAERGFKSAYHETMRETLGEESHKTLNFRNQGKSFFHIDYAFTNVPIRSFNLAPWNGEGWDNAPILSDHSFITIEI